MKRLPFCSQLIVLLTAPLVLAAGPARAQDLPPLPLPPPAPPAPPAPEAQPAPSPQPVQPAPTAQPVQPAPTAQPYPQPYPYPQTYTQPVGPGWGPAQPGPYGYGPPPQYPQPRVAVPPAPDRAPSANWYGWQTLIAIAPFDIAMFAGLARFGDTGGTAAFATGFIGRSLAPGIVHMAHGRVGTGFGSVGLHLATTATGFAVGYGIGIAVENSCMQRTGCNNGFRDIPAGTIYGAVAGSMVGTVLDVVFFAHRQRLSWTAQAPAAPSAPVWALAPYAAPKTAGLAAGGLF